MPHRGGRWGGGGSGHGGGWGLPVARAGGGGVRRGRSGGGGRPAATPPPAVRGRALAGFFRTPFSYFPFCVAGGLVIAARVARAVLPVALWRAPPASVRSLHASPRLSFTAMQRQLACTYVGRFKATSAAAHDPPAASGRGAPAGLGAVPRRPPAARTPRASSTRDKRRGRAGRATGAPLAACALHRCRLGLQPSLPPTPSPRRPPPPASPPPVDIPPSPTAPPTHACQPRGSHTAPHVIPTALPRHHRPAASGAPLRRRRRWTDDSGVPAVRTRGGTNGGRPDRITHAPMLPAPQPTVAPPPTAAAAAAAAAAAIAGSPSTAGVAAVATARKPWRVQRERRRQRWRRRRRPAAAALMHSIPKPVLGN